MIIVWAPRAMVPFLADKEGGAGVGILNINPFDKLRSSTPRSLRLEEVDAERSPAPSGAGRSRSIKNQISKIL